MALTEPDMAAADARLAEELRHTATAVAARYDRGRGRVVVRLNTGFEVMFAPHDAEGLERAAAADLEEIEISPTGLGLHFLGWTRICMCRGCCRCCSAPNFG
jgi:hypothetical protein